MTGAGGEARQAEEDAAAEHGGDGDGGALEMKPSGVTKETILGEEGPDVGVEDCTDLPVSAPVSTQTKPRYPKRASTSPQPATPSSNLSSVA